MTRGTRPPASRAAILRYTHRLAQVRKGVALLTRKRQSLPDELFARARSAVSSRDTIDAHAVRAWEALWHALAATGSDGLTPLAWPAREVDIELRGADVWGIRIARLVGRPAFVRSPAARGTVAGLGDAAAHHAAGEFERLLEEVIDAASEEHVMRRLGDALARTTRLVNTLEQRVSAGLAGDLAAMRQTLAEREREEHVRFKRIVAQRMSIGVRGNLRNGV